MAAGHAKLDIIFFSYHLIFLAVTSWGCSSKPLLTYNWLWLECCVSASTSQTISVPIKLHCACDPGNLINSWCNQGVNSQMLSPKPNYYQEFSSSLTSKHNSQNIYPILTLDLEISLGLKITTMSRQYFHQEERKNTI